MGSGGKSGLAAPLGLLVACGALQGVCGCGGAAAHDGSLVDCEPAFDACDVAEVACQARMAEALACMTGRRVVTPEVEAWQSDDALAYFTPTGQSAERAELLQRQLAALALFRLVPDGYSSDQAIEVYSASVGTFYDPDQERIVVVEQGMGATDSDEGPMSARMAAGDDPDDAPPPAVDEVAFKNLVHELTHAVRDQRTGLPAFYADAETTDAWLAARAVVEGEAQLYAQLAWLDAVGEDPAELDWEQVLAPARQAALATFVAVDAPFSLADRYLPYPYGYAYVTSAWLEGGLDAVDDLYDAPPRSTRAVTAGYGVELTRGGLPALLDSEQAVPSLPERYEPVGAGQYGSWLVDACIQRFRDEPGVDLSWDVMRHLEGDVISLYHDHDSDSALAVWRLRFSDASAAAALRTIASWEPAVQVHVEGQDAILLAVGSGGPGLDPAALQWQSVIIVPAPPTSVDNALLAATAPPS
jgi:hypothetical protein